MTLQRCAQRFKTLTHDNFIDRPRQRRVLPYVLMLAIVVASALLSNKLPLPIAPTPPGVSKDLALLLECARTCRTSSDGLILAQEAFDRASDRSALDRAVTGHVLCFFLYRAGAAHRAIAHGESILPLLIALRLNAAYLETLRWIGVCAVDIDRFDLGIKYGTTGSLFAEQNADAPNRVLALSLLGGALGRSGDPWQGEQMLREAVAAARALPKPCGLPLIVAMNNLTSVLVGMYYTLRGSEANAEALRALSDAVPLAREVVEQSPVLQDPFFETFSFSMMGELLVHSGELDEADVLLTTALSYAERAGFNLLASRVRCSKAELAVTRGDTRDAEQFLRDSVTHESTPATMAMRLRLHYALYQSYRKSGDANRALQSLEAFQRKESLRATEQLRARSALMLTRFEAADNERKVLKQAYDVVQAQIARASDLERLASQDALTGLLNRRGIDAQLPALLATATATAEPMSLVIADLDFFKRINDEFGHAVGDRVLVQVAKLFGLSTRHGDLVARTGGEEFLLVLPGLDGTAAVELCERLRVNVMRFPWSEMIPKLSVTLSVGIACAPPYNMTTLIERADFAMYRAKRAGRNRVVMAA
jgi:diguanylate cyclase (GGDEF)-like protein